MSILSLLPLTKCRKFYSFKSDFKENYFKKEPIDMLNLKYENYFKDAEDMKNLILRFFHKCLSSLMFRYFLCFA